MNNADFQARWPQLASQTTLDTQAQQGQSARTGDLTPVVGKSGGFRKTVSFGLVCIVYYGTELFCRRNFNLKTDPLGKTTGQMVGAARSAKQNIVEGSARAGTSRETELRLYDVAKGSLEELAGDYEDFLIVRGELPWSEKDPRARKVRAIDFDAFEAHDDLRHNFAAHLMQMRAKFAPATENENPCIAANAMLVVIDRACALLRRQIDRIGENFRENGGFTEHLTKVRLESREAKAAEAADSPKCPKCGGPMRKQMARKGANAGNPFWSCAAYPNCNGTRPWDWH